MVALLQEQKQFLLPVRIRNKPSSADCSPARIALADRIAELPGIRTLENGSATLPSRVSVYLQEDALSLRKQLPPRLLCEISKEGLSVRGLSDADRNQVLCRGWGTLDHDCVVVYLPRDEAELEVCWKVLRRAYCSLTSLSARRPALHPVRYGDLPRFSRTTL